MSPPRQPPEAIPTSVFRTLRFQLIAIAVLTVATVLVLSQWVDTRLSERAQERDLGAPVARSLECVIHVGEVVAQERPAAQPVGQP